MSDPLNPRGTPAPSDQAYDQGGYPPPATDPGYDTARHASSADATRDVAKDEAAGVAADAKSGAADVARTAKAEAGPVAADARQQAQVLYRQTVSELGDHAGVQRDRAVTGLRSLAGQLDEMTQATTTTGVASDLTRLAANGAHDAANWLDGREAGDIAEEMRRFARRRPGAFLAGAAVLGLLGGRLTRGLAAEMGDEGTTGSRSTTGRAVDPATGRAYAPAPGGSGAPGTGAAYATSEEPADEWDHDRNPLTGTPLGTTPVRPVAPDEGLR